MTKAAAKTGVGPTVLAAVEQHFPTQQRILDDGLAQKILPVGMQSFVWLMKPRWLRDWMVRATEKEAPGLWSGMMCRKRYIDEKLVESAGEMGAVLNLGAGFDTRLYRLPALADLPAWEVDQPENIKTKQRQLRKIFGIVPPHRTLVALDFDRENLATALATYGYAAGTRTFVIWEAVTQYLTAESVRTTLASLAHLAPGSRLAATYILQSFLDGQATDGWEKLYKDYVPTQIWRFGMDPEAWPDLLAEFGWQLLEDVSYGELAKRYVQPTGRALATTEVERVIYAEKV